MAEPDEPAAADEHNHYKDTLARAKNTTVPNQRDAVYHGNGNPADGLLGDLSGGGWVCSRATDFATTLRGQTAGVTGAFDDAIGLLNTAWSAEPERVPAGDHRGTRWPRTWSQRSRML